MLAHDLTTETLVSLPEVLRLLPPGRRGKRPHLSTVLRWIMHGTDGVRLEAIRLGGRWVTSREALRRYAERLTPSVDGGVAQIPRPPAARRRASERAGRELQKVGI
jgi:hypothetical protein